MKTVTIYTSNKCEACHEAKEFFEENNIKYTELSISDDMEVRKELMQKGYRSVPIIMVDDEVMVGFNEEELSELLGL